MISLNSALMGALLSLTLAACGGGGGDEPDAETVKSAPPPLHVIGNSITFALPSQGFNWSGSWGMAASAQDKDFAHVAGAALGMTVTVANFWRLEMEPAANVASIATYAAAVTANSAVVIELGDNSNSVSDFGPAYVKLLDAVKHANRIACVSTWWEVSAKDAMIKAACEAVGGRYVYIGDVKHDPKNRDLIDGPQYTDSGVQDHPHDWSMKVIGERVAAALK